MICSIVPLLQRCSRCVCLQVDRLCLSALGQPPVTHYAAVSHPSSCSISFSWLTCKNTVPLPLHVNPSCERERLPNSISHFILDQSIISSTPKTRLASQMKVVRGFSKQPAHDLPDLTAYWTFRRWIRNTNGLFSSYVILLLRRTMHLCSNTFTTGYGHLYRLWLDEEKQRHLTLLSLSVRNVHVNIR